MNYIETIFQNRYFFSHTANMEPICLPRKNENGETMQFWLRYAEEEEIVIPVNGILSLT